MAFAPAFRRVLTSSSSSSALLLRSHSHNTSIRLNSTLTTPKLFISAPETRRSVEDCHRSCLDLIKDMIDLRQSKFVMADLKICKRIGLSRLTTDEKLRETFSPFGRLLDVKVATERVTGKSKGYGFVTYATIEEAETAKREMNARFLDGWVIFVDPAKPRREPTRRPPPQGEQPSSETGFRVNKTIGWCR